MKRLYILFVFVLAGLTLQAQEMKTLTWGGVERQYYQYVPASYTGETSVPLVLCLHGLGEGAMNFFNVTNFASVAEQKGWILVYPQALNFTINIPFAGSQDLGPCWNVGSTVTISINMGGYPISFDVSVNPNVDDSGFLNATLDQVENDFNIDADSVFVMGFSLGGLMSHRMAIEHGDRINAIAAISGEIGNELTGLTPTGHVSVLQVHGTDDQMISYEGANISYGGYGPFSVGLDAEETVNWWSVFNNCNLDPVIELYPDSQDDYMTFEMHSHLNGDNGSRVALLKVNGGEHNYYTSGSYDIDYTEEIVRFFINTLDVTSTPELTTETLNVHPNPANSFITIDGSAPVSIIDLMGKTVLQSQGKSHIDVSSLSEGVYFVKSGDAYSKLIISR